MWQQWLEEASLAWKEGRYHDGLQLCDRAAQEGGEARYRSAMLRGDILMDMGDAAGALSSYDSIADPSVPDPGLDFARGIALFELTRLPEAENALRSAHRGDPQLADALYALALVAEILGTGEEVEFFRRARSLAPERFPARTYCSRQEFEEIVRCALDELPDAIREAMAAIEVLVAEVPHPDDLLRSEPAVPPTSLGMFVGVVHGDGEGEKALEKPAIMLFKRNLERAFPERALLVTELRRIVIDELTRALELNIPFIKS